MNQTLDELSNIWNCFQISLFPWLHEELGELTDKQQQLIRVLEVSQIERHIPYAGQVPGRPLEERCPIARAFVAKAMYNLPTTEMLLDQLIGHISRDSTAIDVREKPEKKVAEIESPKKRGRPGKGENASKNRRAWKNKARV